MHNNAMVLCVQLFMNIIIDEIGKGTKRVQDSLMKLLGDEDRLVRQSSCLAQALLKETKAVQKISDLWYVVTLSLHSDMRKWIVSMD